MGRSVEARKPAWFASDAGRQRREELRKSGAEALAKQAAATGKAKADRQKAKKETWWTIETVNPNTFSTGGHYVISKVCKAHLVLLQEALLREEQAKCAEDWA